MGLLLTYEEVLQWLGLQNWQFILLSLVLLILWSFVSMLWKLKAMTKLKVDKIELPRFDAVYISYQGSYDSFSTIFNQVHDDFQTVFKASNPFAIFYSPHQGTAVIGIAVNPAEKGKADLFLSKYPMYKRRTFAATDCLKVKYPLMGEISPIMAIGHAYPALRKEWETIKGKDSQQAPIIEVYHTTEKEPFMSILMPLVQQQRYEVWYEPTDYTRVYDKKEEAPKEE